MSEDCPYCVFETTEANCRGCFEGSHFKPKFITNADRIRAMTDEDLAAWIYQVQDVDAIRKGNFIPQLSKSWWLDWLKQEANE